MRPITLLAFALLLLALPCHIGYAETPPTASEENVFTNHAGIQLYATPKSLNEDTHMVRLRKLDGTILEVPLNIFPQSEQARILAALEYPIIPDDLKAPLEHYRQRLAKARALCERGLLTPAELRETEARLAKAWALRLQRRAKNAPPMPHLPDLPSVK